jgi:hypothetical protein
MLSTGVGEKAIFVVYCIYIYSSIHISYMKHFAFLFLLSGVLLAAPALATDETASSTDSGTTPVVETASGLECIGEAIEARDEAIMDAFDTYHTAAKAALQTRITDLKSAWAQPKGTYRKADIKDVWGAYKTDLRAARKEFKLDKKVAWDAFKKAKASCRGVQVSDDTGASSADTTL